MNNKTISACRWGKLPTRAMGMLYEGVGSMVSRTATLSAAFCFFRNPNCA